MIDYITPRWPAPSNVKAMFTTRNGGASNNANGAYATLNLGMHVHDHPENVAKNRALLRQLLPNEPQWLLQVHGTRHVWMEQTEQRPEGDAALSRLHNTVCAIMVADCLPVFICDTAGTIVGVIHAGWRGLAAGIIEQSIDAMGIDSGKLIAWLGPAIGPEHFVVGEDVMAAFIDQDPQSAEAFTETNNSAKQSEKKWLTDIFQLARQRLRNAGVKQVYGGGLCTYNDPKRFFSYRRDGKTGRMAALIWMEKP